MLEHSTAWLNAGNLFKDRNWLLPLNYLDNGNESKTENEPKIIAGVTSPRPPIKEAEEPKTNNKATEKCGWGPDCPSCKSQKEEESKAKQQKTSPKPKLQKPKARRPKTLNQNMTKAKQQWEAEMERLNSKYNLNYFSDSELDSESDKGEQYHYKQGYETLI